MKRDRNIESSSIKKTKPTTSPTAVIPSTEDTEHSGSGKLPNTMRSEDNLEILTKAECQQSFSDMWISVFSVWKTILAQGQCSHLQMVFIQLTLYFFSSSHAFYFYFIIQSFSISSSFNSLPKLKLTYLRNHWAREHYQSYSEQSLNCGTLVLTKLHMLKPARRQVGIRKRLCMLFAKHSLSQALKKNAGGTATGKERVEAKVKRERERVCGVCH